MSKKKKAFEYLKKVRKATSLQIRKRMNTVAPASMMADLRKLKCDIASKLLYTTDEGVQVWEYELLSWPVNYRGA
jgi:hypothetical protein